MNSTASSPIEIRHGRYNRVWVSTRQRKVGRDRLKRCPECSGHVDGDLFEAALCAALVLEMVRRRHGQLDHVRLDVPVSLVVT